MPKWKRSIALQNPTGIVLSQHRELYAVFCETDGVEVCARVTGRLAYTLEEPCDYPVVGDRVALRFAGQTAGQAVILEVLPRRSLLVRAAAGTQKYSQPIAANLDVLFICTSLNQELNQRRLERYLAAAHGAGIVPVIVLTKADLCPDAQAVKERVVRDNPGVEIIACSAAAGTDCAKVRSRIGAGQAAFIGSSGVGKSTLVNALLGAEALRTHAIREDDARGRHTTTHRQLVRLEGGGAIIDMPGMRELALDESDVDGTFEEIGTYSAACRFSDCTHTHEPGCAVRRAVEDGRIDRSRYESYLKLRSEEDARGRRKRRGR